jgi:hypothetical protein
MNIKASELCKIANNLIRNLEICYGRREIDMRTTP